MSIATVSIGLGLVTGCSTKDCCGPTPSARQLRIAAPLVQQTSAFAVDAFKRLNQSAAGGDVFFSPLSLHMALGMVLNGANGTTKTEMLKAMSAEGQSLTDLNQAYAQLMQDLPLLDPQVQIRLANSVWYRTGFVVTPAFQTTLTNTFLASVSGLDFNAPASVAIINEWVNSRTNGLIPKMVETLRPDEVMLLLNAIYFKGDWKAQFDPAKTVDMPFTLTNGSKKQVRMMRLDTDLRRAFRPTYTAFELPYGSGNTAMTVLLPRDETTADKLLTTFTPADWTQLQTDMTSGKIDIGLPKFKLQYEAKLNDILSQMGMPTAFTDRADFTGINPNGGLLLTSVKQKAYVAVDEKGTTAAAVTGIGVGVTSVGPQPYLCDRPFVVVIHEKASGTILFMGNIANPTETL